MINDDLPTNPEYLDNSFGAAAGLRELEDDDLDEFYPESESTLQSSETIVSKFGGETIKMLCPSITIIENFYDTITSSATEGVSE